MPIALKKTTLSPEENKNFRSISNLRFVPKIVEKSFVRFFNLLTKNFIVQRLRWSVFTWYCYILIRNQSVILLLLDISAALDFVDDDILLLPLCKRFAISRVCVKMVQFENDDHTKFDFHQGTCGFIWSSVTLQFGDDLKKLLSLLYSHYCVRHLESATPNFCDTWLSCGTGDISANRQLSIY